MLAKATGVSLRSVQRILEAHHLAPHRIRTFKLSNDPRFAEKLKDIVGLYAVTLELMWEADGKELSRELTFYVYPRQR